ncbi:MAG: cell wall-binding protein [Eubacteriales bacterium]|nr:cell wall-binding protein [Eubacteriales bacterium]
MKCSEKAYRESGRSVSGISSRCRMSGSRIAAVLLAAGLAAGMMPMTSLAASRKKISSVSVNVESNIQPETRFGDEFIEVEVKSGKCSFGEYEIENFGFEWEEDDVPEITIYLYADEGYYFSLTKASAVKLNGAKYVKASKQDSSETLKLTVKLPSLAETIGEQTEVTLTDGGYAFWEPVRGAGSYEVRLYRNGEGIGASILTTEQPQYDLTDQMSRPGNYQCKVRAVNKINTKNKSEWVESAGINLSDSQAEAIRNGTAVKMPVRGDWRLTGEKWWYEHSDGSYTRNNWEEIKGKWYFFDEEGYMKTGWIQWNDKWYYCKESSGEMLRDTTTPDGYILDSDGSIKNDTH